MPRVREFGSENSTLKKPSIPIKIKRIFLCQLTQEQLKYVLFSVRRINQTRSQERLRRLWFGDRKEKRFDGYLFYRWASFRSVLIQLFTGKKRRYHHRSGVKLGEHQGLMYYTIGQRKGLGIGGHPDFSLEPWFVVGKKLATHELIVGQGYHHPLLYAINASSKNVNWIPKHKFECFFSCCAKFRYRKTIYQSPRMGWMKTTLKVSTNEPVRAITPGNRLRYFIRMKSAWAEAPSIRFT